MTPEQMEEIRGRAEAATPGEWVVEGPDETLDHINPNIGQWEIESPQMNIGGRLTFRDATFIAHARTDVPALLSSLQAAQEEIERWRNNADNERERADDAQARVGVLEAIIRDLFDNEDVQVVVAGNPSVCDGIVERVRQALSEGGGS